MLGWLTPVRNFSLMPQTPFSDAFTVLECFSLVSMTLISDSFTVLDCCTNVNNIQQHCFEVSHCCQQYVGANLAGVYDSDKAAVLVTMTLVKLPSTCVYCMLSSVLAVINDTESSPELLKNKRSVDITISIYSIVTRIIQLQ